MGLIKKEMHRRDTENAEKKKEKNIRFIKKYPIDALGYKLFCDFS